MRTEHTAMSDTVNNVRPDSNNNECKADGANTSQHRAKKLAVDYTKKSVPSNGLRGKFFGRKKTVIEFAKYQTAKVDLSKLPPRSAMTSTAPVSQSQSADPVTQSQPGTRNRSENTEVADGAPELMPSATGPESLLSVRSAQQWQIQDIAAEYATKPLPPAFPIKMFLPESAPQASHEASGQIDILPETMAAAYVKSELNAPAYTEFRKKDTLARETMRLRHDRLFLAAVGQPAAEGCYSAILEELDDAYDTAYALAFSVEYTACRQKAYTETMALKSAGAMAAVSVFIDFLASEDPARNSYAKVMEKFEQRINESQEKISFITYELLAEKSNSSLATAPVPTAEAAHEATTIMLETQPAQLNNLPPAKPPRKAPLDKLSTAFHNESTVTPSPMTLKKSVAKVDAPPKPPRKPASIMENPSEHTQESGAAITRPLEHLHPVKNPNVLKGLPVIKNQHPIFVNAVKLMQAAPPEAKVIPEAAVEADVSLSMADKETKKPGRTISSWFASSSKPSVKTFAKRMMGREKSYDMNPTAPRKKPSSALAGNDVPGMNSHRTAERIEKDAIKAEANVKWTRHLPAFGKHP